MIKILVSGPRSAGKTVLVRRVISLYDRVTPINGGIGALPGGYDLLRLTDAYGFQARARVLGNYAMDSRSRHGMAEFDRYRADFTSALRRANASSLPILCEGGFMSPRRIDTDEGREFAEDLQIIYLSPDADVPWSGASDAIASTTSWVSEKMIRTLERLIHHGAAISQYESRDMALACVCHLLDPDLDWTKSIVPAQDYR